MTRLTLALVCALSLLSAGTKKFTVEDSLAINRVAGPKFSPDGNWVVYTQTEWDQKGDRMVSHVWLTGAKGSATPVKLTNGEKGESAPAWSPDGKHIAFLADRTATAAGAAPTEGARAATQIWLIRPAGGEAEKLTSEENSVTAFKWSPNGKHVAFLTRDTPKDKADREKRKKDKFDAILVDSGFTYAHIWTIDLVSKKKDRITEGAYSAASPAWSPDSKSIAFVRTTNGAQDSGYFVLDPDKNSDIYVVNAAPSATPRKLTTNLGPDTNPVWSPDGTHIAYVAQSDPKAWAGKNEIMIVPAAGGTPRNVTPDFPDGAGANLKWSPDGKSIYWDSAEGLRHHLFRVPASGGRFVHVTEGERLHSDFDLSADGTRAVSVIDDGKAPPDIWSLDLNGSGRGKLTNANPQVADFDIANAEAVRWKGPDNFDVEGLLTYPLGYTPGKKIPLVVSIHGGPYGAHSARFDARSQIFAAHGYAVLAPNPRGSTGYGMKFETANISDWGGKDFGDIMAGVDALVAKGIADPDKMVVMGGSYGGFMTFWTITQTNRFKAAIGHAGISDWYSFHGQSDIPGLMEYGFGGQPWVSTETYRKFSPMTFVGRVKTPIMITHGEQDRRVAIAQAEEYYRALKGVGVETIFVRYPREGHGIAEPNHQVDLVGRQLEWFKRHLGN